ncbi:hypothetical protein LP420_26830 [Massilia sp. B-10]|nr:hypothetical protein LP420_26830 [Massilia sp. B-10]UUZ52718.1 hypothetical protein LP419_26295 [Massilia sp. H-1]
MNELDNEDEFASIDFSPAGVDAGYKPDWWVDDEQRGTWQDGYKLS